MADGGKGGGCVCVERERQDATSQPRSPPRKSVYTERKGKKHDARREKEGEKEREMRKQKSEGFEVDRGWDSWDLDRRQKSRRRKY